MNQATWLGHPRGLVTLFMTEFFERFTYYGMRGLLVLFLVAATDVANPGFGLSERDSNAIYGLYAGAVYLFSLPGGWVADRLIGQRSAVFWGGVIIMIGNFVLSIPGGPPLFYLGLCVIVVGVGLLKPNISAIVGELYKDLPGAKRDAGFSIFYAGINLGALLSPLVAGTIGEGWNWRAGFFCSGLFMAIGLVQFKLTEKYLGEAGKDPHPTSPGERARGFKILWASTAVLAVLVGLVYTGAIGVTVSISTLAEWAGYVMGALAVAYFAGVLLFGGLTPEERGRVGVIAIFFLCAVMFWAGFEQQATSFNLFAQDYTDRSWIGGWFPEGVHPATWYQSANPVFVVMFAPFFAYLWVWLGMRNLEPSAPAKFGFGLILLAIGFLIMMGAAQLIIAAGEGSKAAPTWLLMTFLLHTFGELCLSPVGLSNVTKLAPQRFVGQMMGTWFLGSALGNLVAGIVGGHVAEASIDTMPNQMLSMFFIGGGAGLAMLLFTPVIKKMMGGVK
jgi:POT family proton-dependent oligopeptide transporter